MENVKISIHAARMGCDNLTETEYNSLVISIHAARMGCDQKLLKEMQKDVQISIHAARMGCDGEKREKADPERIISIHAARMGCDATQTVKLYSRHRFQSTQPEWAATSLL